MAIRINRIPPGLLALLDAQSSGVNPVALHEELTGNVDLTDLYLAANSQLRTSTTGAAAAVGRVDPSIAYFFRANPGELIVLSFVVAQPTVPLAAGISCKFRVCVFDYTLGNNVWAGQQAVGLTGEQPCASADRVLVVPPGFGVGVQVDQIAGGAATFSVKGLVSILKV